MLISKLNACLCSLFPAVLDFCAVLHFCYIMYNIYKFDFVIRGLYNIFNKQDSAVLYFYHQTAGFFV